jgi:2,4-dienoyl-CoA reductase-like NADH-dependent reductase (Old Yellow Enzyme family)
MARLERIFEPITIGGVNVRNRIVMTGHGTGMAAAHLPSEQHVAYYAARARGGVGLIGMAFPQIHPSSQNVPGEVQAFRPEIVPGLRRITDAVHEHGARIVMQLGHVGRQSSSTWSEHPLWAASSIPCPLNREMPKEMELDDIEDIVRAHGVCALHAREGGMDGVEMHSGYGGYLLSNFLSPYSNRRIDDYGGSLENRMRLLLRALQAVRAAVGDDYCVGLNIQGDDYSPGGLSVDDCREIAHIVASTGMVDYLVVKGSTYYSASQNVPDMQHPRMVWTHLAAALKRVVEIPVIAVGRVIEGTDAEEILVNGHADMVAMTRQHIADPETVNKLRAGRDDDIRRCISCNQGCIDRLFKITHTTCVHNPAAGYEREFGEGTLTPTDEPRRIVVVGAGPAGMKFSEVAARRGHEVTLLERRDQVGGQLRLAASVDGRGELAGVYRYLEHQLAQLQVTVRLGTEATVEMMGELGAEAVVVATGSSPTRQLIGNLSRGVVEVSGIDSAHVIDVWDLLEGGAEVGECVLVVDDGEGGWKSSSVALSLAADDRRVLFATPLAQPGASVGPFSQNRLLPRFFAANIELHAFASLIEVTDEGAVLAEQGRRVEVAADTIVLAGWHRPETELYFACKQSGLPTYRVGDAVASRSMLEAIHDAERLARSV